MTTNYLPDPITLPSGVVAKLEVTPTPKPDANGRYRPRLVTASTSVCFAVKPLSKFGR